MLDLDEEPAVDPCQCKHFVNTPTSGECVAEVPDPVRSRLAQFLLQQLTILSLLVHAVNTDFQAPQGFLERFLKSATNRHHLTHRFHLGGQPTVGCRELFKGEARNFGDHVVDTRLKTRWRCTACDLVAQLIQRITHSKFGSHLGDRKPGGFGGQSGRARDARIHLDNDHASVVRVDGELYIGATGVDADLAQHGQTGVAQNLVFLVAQRLGWCHRDRVACVHTHRVEIFDRADDDAVVCLVAHHLHLEFFPAQKRFFNQQFVGR